ncbi:MAG: hypothetical protein EBS49_05790 [Verrucomicrobia bacterium]|nr:hypothetical protein [Verrucomicrobiota bacterium]
MPYSTLSCSILRTRKSVPSPKDPRLPSSPNNPISQYCRTASTVVSANSANSANCNGRDDSVQTPTAIRSRFPLIA